MDVSRRFEERKDDFVPGPLPYTQIVLAGILRDKGAQASKLLQGEAARAPFGPAVACMLSSEKESGADAGAGSSVVFVAPRPDCPDIIDVTPRFSSVQRSTPSRRSTAASITRASNNPVLSGREARQTRRGPKGPTVLGLTNVLDRAY